MHTRRASMLWGLVLAAIAAVALLRIYDVLPPGLYDVFARAWPVLLILAGLSLLLRRRLPLSNLIALTVSIALVGGVAAVAYSTRAEQERSDQEKSIEQTVDDDVTLLAVNMELLTTDIEVAVNGSSERTVTGMFTGSVESNVEVSYVNPGDGSAVLTIEETKPAQFPLLDAVGRGTLRLEIPQELGAAIALHTESGDAVLNLSQLDLERLSVLLDNGDAVINLPDYTPQSASIGDRPGEIIVSEGDVTVLVPETIAARLELNRGGNNIRPEFDEDNYILIDDGADGTLARRSLDEDETELIYEITAPRGLIRLEVSDV